MEYLDLFIEQTLLMPLNKEDLIKYLKEINKGNKAARKIVIEHNLRLVISRVLNKFYSVHYDKKELVAIGMIGLIKAVDTFDISKNIQFSTYATRCIDNEIYNFLKDLSEYSNDISFDKLLCVEYEELDLKNVIASNINIEDDYIDNEIKNIVKELLLTLTFRERKIIMMYYGFYNNRRYNQTEIAKFFNISQQEISKIINKTLRKLEKKFKLSFINEGDYKSLKKTS